MANPTAQLLQRCRELSDTTGARVLCIVIAGDETAVHNSLVTPLPLTIEQDGDGRVRVGTNRRPAYASVCTAPAKAPPPSAPPALLTSLFTRLPSRPLFGRDPPPPAGAAPEFPFQCPSREHSQEEIVAIHALAELSPE